jgi:putative FmdB family regulatory protein
MVKKGCGMPIYEYQCEACGHRLEALQKISEEPLSDCPECGRPDLQKLISAAGFRLKGGGWYATDFKDGGKKKTGEKPAAGEAKSADKDKTGGGKETAKAAET